MDDTFNGIISNDESVNTEGQNDNDDDNDKWILSEGNKIKKMITDIESITITFDRQIKGIITEVNVGTLEKKIESISKTISDTNKIISKTKNKLDSMIETTGYSEQSNNEIMKKNIHRYLTKRFIDAIGIFNSHHIQFKHFIDEKLTREIKIVNPEISDEHLNLIKNDINNKGYTNYIYPQIFISDEHTKSYEKLRYYNELYKDVIQVEKQISQLKQLFMDASIIVVQQGDLINHIEYNVANSVKYIKKGDEQLEQGVIRSQRSQGSQKCIIN